MTVRQRKARTRQRACWVTQVAAGGPGGRLGNRFRPGLV
jgi:hypothetical protein